jgi:Mrp family chromosome partitioning ATPase
MRETGRDGERAASQNAQFQTLRALVEREVRLRGVIMITSAETADGKSLTAHGLARCLAQSGRRTALVSTCRPSVPRRPVPFGDESGHPTLVTMAHPPAALIRETSAEFVSSLRAQFDYTIVDCAPLLTDDLAIALASHVDGILLCVRVGRASSDRDLSLKKIAGSCGARLLGVVASSPEAISDFDLRCVEVRAPRHATQSQPVSVAGAIVLSLLLAFAWSAVAVAKQLSRPHLSPPPIKATAALP